MKPREVIADRMRATFKWGNQPVDDKLLYLAADVILKALGDEGFVVVPSTPNQAMLCAALDAWDKGERSYSRQWSAMVNAVQGLASQ